MTLLLCLVDVYKCRKQYFRPPETFDHIGPPPIPIMADEHVTSEAALQAEAFKAQGNALLAESKYREAVQMYTRAIELDPDNAVYYSNRSAVFLALGDERGNALRDAEKCIALKPEWWKGYSRKGAAEHALQRYDAARATYQEGLKLAPDNASLLQAAEDAYNAGQEHSKRLREAAKEQERRKKERADAEAEEQRKKEEEEKEKSKALADPADEDALLAEFMSEVQELEENANCVKKEDKPEKKAVDFGTSEGQLVRLLQDHYQWINLNPFRVLMLDVDATDEDIKQHYRKISTLVHPDKFRHPRAREAFEQVTKAYETLLNEDRRKTYAKLIENTRERVAKDRRQKVKKGIKESELGELQEEQDKAVIKAFAEMEHRRQNLEKREAAQKRREAEQQEKEQQESVNMYKRERSWAEEDRREQRVGNWRDFQKGGKRRKEVDAGWKEEKRAEAKHFGVVENDQYKKKWK